MKKLILLGLIFTTFTFANNSVDSSTKATVYKSTEQQILCNNDTKKFLQVERSGCCSWHGGVAGCGYDGRVVCNDGSVSPSCTCAVPTSPTT